MELILLVFIIIRHNKFGYNIFPTVYYHLRITPNYESIIFNRLYIVTDYINNGN
jgi:hypothetical protein